MPVKDRDTRTHNWVTNEVDIHSKMCNFLLRTVTFNNSSHKAVITKSRNVFSSAEFHKINKTLRKMKFIFPRLLLTRQVLFIRIHPNKSRRLQQTYEPLWKCHSPQAHLFQKVKKERKKENKNLKRGLIYKNNLIWITGINTFLTCNKKKKLLVIALVHFGSETSPVL